MKQRTAATASERQAKYRRSRQLSAVFLTKATREAINALQARTGLKKEALVALAIRNLTADLDRTDRRRIGPRSVEASSLANTADKADAVLPASPEDGSSSRTAPPGVSSLSDTHAALPAPVTGARPPKPADLAGKRGARVGRSNGKRRGAPQTDMPDLFGDLPPRR